MNRNRSSFLMPRSDTSDCSIGRNNDSNKNSVSNDNKKNGCLKHQLQQATQQQQHSQQSLTLVQQEHQQQNYPPHNSNISYKNYNNHLIKNNNDFIDVTMTTYSISSYTLNQKYPTNGQKYSVAASSNNNNNIQTLGSKNKNKYSKNHTAPSMLLVSPYNPSLHICELPLLPVQIF
ncbi:probable basic-leucine zipper transcription factor E [Drosophila innubila]|uniref:probable basic-leucine zipper transcription factor E n=1 Tax=Drosophila innubila TaxID=198719 RepID=UPI00148C2C23|nr:probable basic-leucine zipper transcription factor E [Drosophila innubila]